MTGGLFEVYRGTRVLLTGHTGFKGAWLAAWLQKLGAEVTGLALPPEPDRPSLYEVAAVGEGMGSILGDIRDPATVDDAFRAARPRVVFHMAAQSLVRRSYVEPVATYATNVMGTAHVLEAARAVPEVEAVLVVTSDKCYENRGLERGYREDDPMGGFDPYSSSKGCAELLTAAWRRSFFAGHAAVATARAGNVIGGGDWAEDRLVPDLVRAAYRGEPAVLRNPGAVRPWQHVLDPLRGYLLLGERLLSDGDAVAEGWNFGPADDDAVTVRELAERMARTWDRVRTVEAEDGSGPHEAHFLKLDHRKAGTRLGWEPLLDLDRSVELTAGWYREHHRDPDAAPELVARQIDDYTKRATRAVVPPTGGEA